MSNLLVRLPRAVTLTRLKRAATSLPIVGTATPEFKPNMDWASIMFDSSQVRISSAEAIVCRLALEAWVDREAKELPQETRPRIVRTTSKSEGKANGEGWDYLIRPSEMRVPAYAPSIHKSDWASGRKKIAGQAHAMLRQIEESPVLAGEFDSLKGLVEEFLVEALLNVHQHAYPADTYLGKRSCWSCATLYKPEQYEALYPLASCESEAEREWVSSLAGRCQGVVELAIADVGIGIPGSLAARFFASNPSINSELKNLQSVTRVKALHDRILLWALSPYGTRKESKEQISQFYAEAWRGLYRVLYHAQRLGAYLCLSSGFGRLGMASDGAQSASIDARTSDPIAAGKAWPWTLLSLRLPIGLAKRQTSGHVASRDSDDAEIDEIETFDAVLEAPNAMQLAGSSADDPADRYIAQLHQTLRATNLNSLPASGQIRQQLVAVIHPAASFGRLYDQTGPRTGGQIDSERRAYVLSALQKMLTTGMLPGIAFIHFFIDHEQLRLEELEDRLASSVQELDSSEPVSIVGLVSPGSFRIRWLYPAFGGIRGYRTVSLDPDLEPWIARFNFDFPEVISQEGAVTLPRRISQRQWQGLNTRLLGLLAKGASTHINTYALRQRWFWKARNNINGSPDSVVVTASNRFVREFINILTLCSEEPVIEEVMARALFAHIQSRYVAGHPVLLLPDGASASSFLLHRLLARIERRLEEHGIRVNVLNLSACSPVVLEDSQLLIFADAVYFGTRVQTLLNEISKTVQKTGLHSRVGIFIGLRCTPEGLSTGWTPFESWDCFAYPTALPIDNLEEHVGANGAPLLLHLDPITNELIPAHALNEWKRFGSGLIWQSSPEATSCNLTIQDSDLVYGIQAFGKGVHFVRWPTTKHLLRPEVKEALANEVFLAIRSVVRPNEPLPQLLLLTRDNSGLGAFIEDLGSALIDMAAAGPGRARLEVRVGTIPTVQYHGRQTLSRGIYRAQEDAKWLARYDEHGTYDLFGAGPRPDRPVVVYIDNSALSGRALRELVFAYSNPEVMGEWPRLLVLFPIVSRLSPNQERLFRSINTLATNSDKATAVKNSTNDEIRLAFRALVQLRIRSYEKIEDTPYHSRLRVLVESAKATPHDELRTYLSRLDDKITKLNTSSFQWIDQSPLYVEVSGTKPLIVSVLSVEFRQKIALRQQGGPFTHDLWTLLARIRDTHDYSILIVLALEPDLLEEDSLIRAVGKDICALALDALVDRESDIRIRLNALWVLCYFPNISIYRVADILVAIACEKDLLRAFLVLVLHLLSSFTREKFVSGLHSLRNDAAVAGQLKKATNSFFFQILAAEYSVQVGERSPMSVDEARRAVIDFMKTCRHKHGMDGIAIWQDFKIFSSTDLEDADFRALAEIKDEWRTERIQEFVLQTVRPAIRALNRLGEVRDPQDKTRLANAAVRCTRYSSALCELAQELRSGQGDVTALQAAWRNLTENSFWNTVDHMYRDQSDLILRRPKAVAVGAQTPIIEACLFEVVQEPLSLFLMALFRDYDPQSSIKVEISAKDLDDVTTHDGTLGELGKFLMLFWRTTPILPICWSSSAALVEVFTIYAQNIRTHADKQKEIVVRMVVDASGRTVELEVVNSVRNAPRTGSNTGIPRINKLLSKIGGFLETAKVQELFVGRFKLVADVYDWGDV